MYSMISFSIAACRSLRAPSCSNRSKNGFSSSSARLLSEITLFTDIGASFLLASSGEAAGFLLITERMRLFLSPHTQLSVIPLVGVLTRPQAAVADFYRELGHLFSVPLAPHNRWASAKVLREKWLHHIENSLHRPVLLIDEAQQMSASALSELRLLSSA